MLISRNGILAFWILAFFIGILAIVSNFMVLRGRYLCNAVPNRHHELRSVEGVSWLGVIFGGNVVALSLYALVTNIGTHVVHSSHATVAMMKDINDGYFI